MKDSFDKISKNPSTEKYLPEKESEVFHHTASPEYAERLVKGYLRFLRTILAWEIPECNRSIDLGCGLGYITYYFRKNGFNITGLEIDNIAVSAARRHNPDVPFIEGDISVFHEPDRYDFIFSREVYLFTRINSFTDQLRTTEKIIESLKPGGCLLLVGSTLAYPNCCDWKLLIKTLRKRNDISKITGHYYNELIFCHFEKFIKLKLFYHFFNLILTPYLMYKKHKQPESFSQIGIIGILRKNVDY